MSAVYPVELVVTNNVVQYQQCTLYTHAHPLLEAHHVCPESWWKAANKPVGSPLKELCPNCHYGVHVAIDAIIKKQDPSLLKPRWIELANEAFVIAQTNGLTPLLTL